ncbi:MAG TPA: hypothetical protein VG168_07085 [Bryobacteraceae bacterium]|nr:hypothetical protein [Bryobacteraceae bacterium]
MFKHLIFAPMLLAACALAQNNAVVESKPMMVQMAGPGFGQVAITTAMAGMMAPVTGAPYSADTTTQRIQMLADGNRIEQNTSGSVARDSQGRLRRDESLPLAGPDGEEAPHIIMIDDPVAQVHWTLDAQRKVAMKMPFKAGPSLAAHGPSNVPNADRYAEKSFYFASGGPGMVVADGGFGMASRTQIATGGPMDSNEVKTDLGTQTIEGVPARGTRLTRTIPVGQIGNAEPITITTETWYSPDLKVLVMSKSSDPRIGDTSYTLTNIQRSEPSPTLFQPPADYVVKDQADIRVRQ